MKLLRLGICALLACGILAHGGVEDWARAVLETGAGLLLVAWAVLAYLEKKLSIIIAPLLPPIAVLALIVFAQLIFRSTASPYATRQDLQLLVAFLIVMFLAVQLFRTLEDWRTFIWFIMFFGFFVSIFGILQHLTFNGKLYWFREMRYGGIPFGPYVNRNHFAAFAELVIPVALVPLVLGKVRKDRWFIVGLFALVPIGALFLSASRGGILSFAVQLGVLVVIVAFRRTSGKNILAGAAVLLLAVLMVSWLGVRQILSRFSTLQSLEVTVGKRASMRHDTWKIFLDHRWTGTGLGTVQTVFPAYETLYDGKIVNHAHNDYLEAAAETGIPGVLCCAWFLVVLFSGSLRQVLRTDRSLAASLHLSGLVACTGFLVHSLVDFNLHIPANALLFFLMTLLATASLDSAIPETPYPRNHQRNR